MSLLEVERVSKSFGGVQALKGISLTVERGEILGIMGANGAGKTTLFGLIAGHIRPSDGAIRYGGRRIDRLAPHRICRLGIARTFQTVRPFRAITALDNAVTAALFGSTAARSGSSPKVRAEEALAAVGLTSAKDQTAGTLTLVGQKRLEVARALATGPSLLLLDEVMAGLTPAEVRDLLAMLKELPDRYGLTMIVIEHVMRALMDLAGRIVVLHHGELIASGAPASIAADPSVQQAYFGEPEP